VHVHVHVHYEFVYVHMRGMDSLQDTAAEKCSSNITLIFFHAYTIYILLCATSMSFSSLRSVFLLSLNSEVTCS